MSCSSWWDCFKGICPFLLHCQIYRHSIVYNISLFTLNISRFCNDVTSFIPSIYNLYLLPFLLTSVSVGLSLLLVFKQNHIFVSLIFFYYYDLFLFILFNSTLIFFLLFTLSVICSFSSFLSWNLRLLRWDLSVLL